MAGTVSSVQTPAYLPSLKAGGHHTPMGGALSQASSVSSQSLTVAGRGSATATSRDPSSISQHLRSVSGQPVASSSTAPNPAENMSHSEGLFPHQLQTLNTVDGLISLWQNNYSKDGQPQQFNKLVQQHAALLDSYNQKFRELGGKKFLHPMNKHKGEEAFNLACYTKRFKSEAVDRGQVMSYGLSTQEGYDNALEAITQLLTGNDPHFSSDQSQALLSKLEAAETALTHHLEAPYYGLSLLAGKLAETPSASAEHLLSVLLLLKNFAEVPQHNLLRPVPVAKSDRTKPADPPAPKVGPAGPGGSDATDGGNPPSRAEGTVIHHHYSIDARQWHDSHNRTDARHMAGSHTTTNSNSVESPPVGAGLAPTSAFAQTLPTTDAATQTDLDSEQGTPFGWSSDLDPRDQGADVVDGMQTPQGVVSPKPITNGVSPLMGELHQALARRGLVEPQLDDSGRMAPLDANPYLEMAPPLSDEATKQWLAARAFAVALDLDPRAIREVQVPLLLQVRGEAGTQGMNLSQLSQPEKQQLVARINLLTSNSTALAHGQAGTTGDEAVLASLDNLDEDAYTNSDNGSFDSLEEEDDTLSPHLSTTKASPQAAINLADDPHETARSMRSVFASRPSQSSNEKVRDWLATQRPAYSDKQRTSSSSQQAQGSQSDSSALQFDSTAHLTIDPIGSGRSEPHPPQLDPSAEDQRNVSARALRPAQSDPQEEQILRGIRSARQFWATRDTGVPNAASGPFAYPFDRPISPLSQDTADNLNKKLAERLALRSERATK